MTSATTGALAAALAKAQSSIDGAKKDANNPHFKQRYADLASTWQACRAALFVNGLAVVQTTEARESGAVLVTRLLHTSGEWVQGETPLLLGRADMQGLGSAITYARRYGLAAIVGVSPEDDDGNAAVGDGRPAAKAAPKPEGYDAWLLDMEAAADTGLDELTRAWKDSPPPLRAYMPHDVRDNLKARAGKVAA
jgi:hypothetical protein